MSETHFSASHRGLTLPLLAVTFGVSLWAIFGAIPDVSDSFEVSASKAAQCKTAADVMASLERSRNGISLTCNAEILSRAKAQ